MILIHDTQHCFVISFTVNKSGLVINSLNQAYWAPFLKKRLLSVNPHMACSEITVKKKKKRNTHKSKQAHTNALNSPNLWIVAFIAQANNVGVLICFSGWTALIQEKNRFFFSWESTMDVKCLQHIAITVSLMKTNRCSQEGTAMQPLGVESNKMGLIKGIILNFHLLCLLQMKSNQPDLFEARSSFGRLWNFQFASLESRITSPQWSSLFVRYGKRHSNLIFESECFPFINECRGPLVKC